MTDRINITIPVPSRDSDRMELISVHSDRDIEDAGGRLVTYHPEKHAARIATNYDLSEGFRMQGVIPLGYEDIPAGEPFWIVSYGPTLVQTCR